MSSNEMIPPCTRCGGDIDNCNCRSSYSKIASHFGNSEYPDGYDDDHNDYYCFMEDSDFRD